MAQYRKRKDTDTWHFCSNCSNYPTSDYTTSPDKPSSGEFRPTFEDAFG
jgi:hypothetical protein